MNDKELAQEKLERSYLRIQCMLGLGDPSWDLDKTIEYTEYKLAVLAEQHSKLLRSH